MRARLSAIFNFTTSQLLTILQNTIENISEIIVNGHVLTVISVYSSQMTQLQYSLALVQLRHQVLKLTQKEKWIYSVQLVLLVPCHCFFVFLYDNISFIFMEFNSKRNGNLKSRLVVYIM